MNKIRATGLMAARITAVAFALGVAWWLVSRAQERANPEGHRPTVEDPVGTSGDDPAATVTDAEAANERTDGLGALPSSKSLVIDPNWLPSSKGIVVTETVPAPVTPAADGMLFSSKSLVVEPAQLLPGPTNDQVMLFSSKSAVIHDAIAPHSPSDGEAKKTASEEAADGAKAPKR